MANHLFYRRGIRAVGIAEISQSPGVARPTLYRNFESKDGLVVAYLNEHSAADLHVVDAAKEPYPGVPGAQLRFIVAATATKIGTPGLPRLPADQRGD